MSEGVTEEDKGRRRKNDISILRPVLPVSGLISQRLWGAECDQSARHSSPSSLHLQPAAVNPKAGVGVGGGGWQWRRWKEYYWQIGFRLKEVARHSAFSALSQVHLI